MPQSISKKLIIRLFLITAFVNIAISLAFYTYSVRTKESEFQSKIQTEAGQLAGIFTEQLWLFDLSTTEKLVENALSNSDVTWLRLRDQKNNIVAEKGLSGEVQATTIHKDLVHQSGVIVGEMDIAFSHFNKDEEEKLILKISILSALATLILTLTFIIYTMNKHLVLPLKELQKDMSHVASGRYKQSRLVGQTKETQSIIAVYNQMASSLAERESERESLIIQLQERNVEQERFVYTVSHDLKSPLVTISNFSGLAKEDLATGSHEDCKNNLDIISSAAKRMQQLLSELLNISRVGFKMNPTDNVNLGIVIKEAIENVSGIISENKTSVEVDSDLPDVIVDRQYLLQAVENLLTNASRYSRSAKDGSRVKIGAVQNAEEFTCYIKDNGIGIEPQFLEKIFGLFDRLDSASDSSGVGLAIVKRIIETHGGRVWAESEGLGHGTTFFFTLPES